MAAGTGCGTDGAMIWVWDECAHADGGAGAYRVAAQGDDVSQYSCDGVGVLHGLLRPAELQAARRDFERAHVDLGNGAWDHPDNAGTRKGAGGDQLGLLPGLARLYTHPRIVAIVGAIMDGATPWIHAMTTIRCTAGAKAFPPHSDGGTAYAMPWELSLIHI